MGLSLKIEVFGTKAVDAWTGIFGGIGWGGLAVVHCIDLMQSFEVSLES